MIWEKVGQYGMQSGEYRVAKVSVCEHVSYVLHHDWTRLGSFASFNEAKQAALDHKERSDDPR